MSSTLHDCGSSFAQTLPFLLLRRSQSHYRKLPEYSVVLTGVQKHRARAPRWRVLGGSVLLPNQLWSPWHMGKTRERGPGHWETSEAPVSECFVFCEDFHCQLWDPGKLPTTCQVHSTGPLMGYRYSLINNSLSPGISSLLIPPLSLIKD